MFVLERAMDQYAKKTCIRFVPRTNEKDYIRIFSGQGSSHYNTASLPGAADQFFKLKPSQNNLLTDFDYNSIMLYGSFTFSKEPRKLRTMEGKNGDFLYDVLSKGKLSETDIKRIKMLYKC
ncbi:unnamed protein product [Larinioides sclopetarius]|uniref:Metalloendopeptidase n=1 Tax=Larinioides sclopetarius TaxID=280406 RepID=A0AAV1ZIV3_9ARAC